MAWYESFQINYPIFVTAQLKVMDKNKELISRREASHVGGGQARIDKQHQQGKLTARERITLLLDEESFNEIGQFVEHRATTFGLDKQQFPGDGVVTYTLEFYSPDENIKKETDGSVEGHEWMVLAQVPSDLIEKINSGELSLEEGKKQIQSKIEWSYKDGLDKSVGGWQIKTIDSFKQRNQWLSQEKEKDSRNPKWIQKFSNWLTDTFG